MTATPDERHDAGYRAGYRQGVAAMLDAVIAANKQLPEVTGIEIEETIRALLDAWDASNVPVPPTN